VNHDLISIIDGYSLINQDNPELGLRKASGKKISEFRDYTDQFTSEPVANYKKIRLNKNQP
jgi:hypothetical protein